MIYLNQKGKHATPTRYMDATLHYDQVTGRVVTACIHIMNPTPFHWNTIRQVRVETATFGI